jgi:hypothetical protein
MRTRLQLVEVVCFLRVMLLELTDTALQQAVQLKGVLHNETKDGQQRVLEAQRLVAGIDGRADAPNGHSLLA